MSLKKFIYLIILYNNIIYKVLEMLSGKSYRNVRLDWIIKSLFVLLI